MDCTEITDNEGHERYLLGRLDEAERRAYEQHLSGCPSCRQEMVREQQMIAGIREMGREAMKDEIREQVAASSSRESSMNWAGMAKIAALLFVILLAPSVYFVMKKQSPRFDSAPTLREDKAESRRLQKEAPKDVAKAPSSPAESGEAELEETVRDEDVVVDMADRPSSDRLLRLEKQGRVSELRITTPRVQSFSRGNDLMREFALNGRTIRITAFVLPKDEKKKTSHSSTDLPFSFPIRIIRNDSTHLVMNWYVSREFIRSHFDDLRPEIVSAESLQVILKNGTRFGIPLPADSTQTQARLIHEE